MSQILTLCCSKDNDLKEIMLYQIADECLSIFNGDRKTVKFQILNLLGVFPYIHLDWEHTRKGLAIVNMGFIWRMGTPTSKDKERQDPSFKEIKCSCRGYLKKNL